jgi:hypothetical protein
MAPPSSEGGAFTMSGDHVNKGKRRKAANAAIQAEMDERDARILREMNQYTDDRIAKMRRDLGLPPVTKADVISIITKHKEKA